MKKQKLLIGFVMVIITAFYTRCNNTKSAEDIKKDAESFKQSMQNEKELCPTFLKLFGVSNQNQLDSLTIGKPIPFMPIELNDFNNLDSLIYKVNNPKISLYEVPFEIKDTQVSSGFFSVSSSSITPSIITQNCGNILVNHPSYIVVDGKNVPLALPLDIETIIHLSDFEEIEFGIIKFEDKVYLLSFRDSFELENGDFQFEKGKGYSIESVYKLLKVKSKKRICCS